MGVRNPLLISLLLGPLALAGCDDEPPPTLREPASLPDHVAPDEEQSCFTCHPRQFNEWLGSSHNYGTGLDGTFQALELTANYYAAHLLGGPRFRQNLLCVGCHAPTTAVYGGDLDKVDFNETLREGAHPDPNRKRGLPRPEDHEDLVPPLGRAIEMADATPREKAINFQGITCDTCHKVGAPFDDAHVEQLGTDCDGTDPACAQQQFEKCEDGFDPACVRRSRGQHPHGEPFFDLHVATAALPVERKGNVRYGPFGEGEVAAATAHDVSDGATEYARNFDLARHANGQPFEGQEPDIRPFIKSSHFCGTCHDVRFPPLAAEPDPITPGDEPRNKNLEPVHNEPFLRLENLYTEWFISPLNLHPMHQGPSDDPRLQFPENPYRHEDGSAKRVVCQDCHMSLFPYAPPGTFPGAYTHPENCDGDDCGLTIASGGARANLKIATRPRVTTHNMTGVDIALGDLAPVDPEIAGTMGVDLPFQTGDMLDEVYKLPQSLDARRIANLKNAVTVSLAGTPEVLRRGDPDNCSDEQYEHLPPGTCNLPVKAWVTNINGGHNIAAGFSQERQIWVELTVQDLGAPKVNGMAPIVDCNFANIDDLYVSETVNPDGSITRVPKKHTVESAIDVFDRLTGFDPAHPEDTHFHATICRGASGHLIDKPHDETHEAEADGRLDDEDILLHRIGNTVPRFKDGRHLISWHVADLGFDYDHNDLPLDPKACESQYGPKPEIVSSRVTRADQFHVPGLNVFECQLTEDHLLTKMSPDGLTVTLLDGSVAPLSSFEGVDLVRSVTTTPDERLEILYPFPEYPPLLAHRDKEGHFHFGERFGLAYITNIFYQTCNCAEGECEGPEEVTIGGQKLHAQVPWLKTYPTLPHTDGVANHFPLDDGSHRAPEQYHELLQQLAAKDPKIKADCEGEGPCGTTYREAFTFVPLNADHMPNNRSLKFYQPQRHYWDIRVPPDVVGPIRVNVKVWYRHFPPEFLRLMARFTEGAYRRACAEGRAEEFFPHGPLVVEGELAKRFPNAANIDNLRRVLLDEAVFTIDVVNEGQQYEPEVPANPTWARDVEPIIRNNCTPCHSDVLRHGGLILEYDDYPQYDYPPGQDPNPTQDPRLNLIGQKSKFDERGRPLVIAGDAGGSLLMDLLTRTDEELRRDGILSRRMPLKTDALSQRDIATIRKWIETGAK